MDKRGAHRAGLDREPKALHETRRVHVTVANADAGTCGGFANGRRGDPGQGEAERRNALRQLRLVADAVDARPRLAQYPQQLSDRPCS